LPNRHIPSIKARSRYVTSADCAAIKQRAPGAVSEFSYRQNRASSMTSFVVRGNGMQRRPGPASAPNSAVKTRLHVDMQSIACQSVQNYDVYGLCRNGFYSHASIISVSHADG